MNAPRVLTDDILERSRQEPDQFGFNGLGEFVFNRTYVRVKPDGTTDEPYALPGTKGDLTAVLARVVEGTYRLQREHQPATRWNEEKAQRSAAKMFDYMKKFYFLPPGRGLWTMGTDFVHERGTVEALQNCAFMSTGYIATEGGDAWRWFTEMLMLGVGVGFDSKGAGKITMQQPQGEPVEFVVADTREGWADLMAAQWNSYQNGTAPIYPNVEGVRPFGAAIGGFGGLASGPGPLVSGFNKGKMVLDAAVGQLLSSRTIVDYANLIGEFVVAGNVRRSAEIALGSPLDEAFLDLKNPEVFGGWEGLTAARPWYWLSNNSLLVEGDGDEPDYFAVAKRIYENGEPGIVWMDTAKAYGRYGETMEDWDAEGVNPCAEQQLGHREMCTLVEVFMSRIPDLETYIDVLKYAYLYGKSVSVANEKISDPTSRAIMNRNRRIGLSTTGLAQFLAQHGREEMIRWWRAGYEAIQEYDDIYSRWFGVPRSIRTTSIKPSGTVALLPGVTPGAHYPVSRFYKRRVDVAANSQLVPALRAAGYVLEDSLTQPGVSFKVVFPVDAGEGVRAVSEVSLIEQIQLAADAQEHHSDNMVSFTGTFVKSQVTVEDIAEALEFARGRLKSISLLPDEHGYQQAPYEPIDEAEYLTLLAPISKVDYTALQHEKTEEFCETDVCEIREFNSESELAEQLISA